MAEIQQTQRSDDFDLEASELTLEKWNYKQLVFYDLNRYQQASKMPPAQGDEAGKINNMFIGIDTLYILVSPCMDRATRDKAEQAFRDYEAEEKRLILFSRPPNNMQPHIFLMAVNSNRHKYVRTIHQLIIDSLQAQGLLLRKKTATIAGSNRPLSRPKGKK